jgi:hypothetical protein
MTARLLKLVKAERARVISEMARLAEQEPPGHGSWNSYLADVQGAIAAIEAAAESPPVEG